MTLFETANNAFLAMIAAPEALHEARELLRERHEQELNAPRVERLMRRIAELESELHEKTTGDAWHRWATTLMRDNGISRVSIRDSESRQLISTHLDSLTESRNRSESREEELKSEHQKLKADCDRLVFVCDNRDRRIADLEHNLESAESSNANLTELVEKLESELATLRAKGEPAIPETSALSPDWVLNQLAGLKFPGAGEAYRYMRKCIAGAFVKPEVGDGFEFCDQASATHICFRGAPLPDGTPTKFGRWVKLTGNDFEPPAADYRFRRPIAKPEPQWVACTAEEELTADGK